LNGLPFKDEGIFEVFRRDLQFTQRSLTCLASKIGQRDSFGGLAKFRAFGALHKNGTSHYAGKENKKTIGTVGNERFLLETYLTGKRLEHDHRGCQGSP
jgi:hypothetical protein